MLEALLGKAVAERRLTFAVVNNEATLFVRLCGVTVPLVRVTRAELDTGELTIVPYAPPRGRGTIRHAAPPAPAPAAWPLRAVVKRLVEKGDNVLAFCQRQPVNPYAPNGGGDAA
ncbi:hypothetical protein SAMN05660859_0024 [Ancylobacter rudongensis]|uniref:Uncharacterized protein n=2 Tax=Ancylobacter rudongensis TaxID=177413 RepID=A0A1G4UP59_9HYPH|nr:hypothetical protein SAMN05660859_0024 [Ancylobacter rudongensis]